jgi:hypothetical protein
VSSTCATMSAPTSSSSAAFVALTLGCSANAIEILVPPAPPVHAADDLKARTSFDFLADLLAPHAALCSSAKLFAAFAGHMPASACNATLEAKSVCCALRSSFFNVQNLIALGFCDHLGLPISLAITDDTTNHPPGVTHFAFRSTIGPNTVNAPLSIPSHSFEFWLALPQTVLGAEAPSVPAAAEIACTRLNLPLHTKTPPPAPPLLLMLSSLPRTLPPWMLLPKLLLVLPPPSTSCRTMSRIALPSSPLPRSNTLSFAPPLLLLLLLPSLSSLLCLPK